jgi:hypothetical protein
MHSENWNSAASVLYVQKKEKFMIIILMVIKFKEK